MEYQFSEKRIKKQIKKIESLPRTETTSLDIAALNILLYKYSETPLLMKYPKCLYIYHNIYSEILRFHNLTKTQELSDDIWTYNSPININDLFTILHDFYKTRDKKIYESFLKNFKKRKTNLEITKYKEDEEREGYCCQIRTLKEAYISIDYTNSINDLICLAHEYGHATMFNLNPNIVTNPNYVIYNELDGIYFENEMIDYLLKNNIYPIDVLKNRIINHKYMNEISDELREDYNLKTMAYLLSYMISIELRDNDHLVEEILSYNPASPLIALNIALSNIDLNENTFKFQEEINEKAQTLKLNY